MQSVKDEQVGKTRNQQAKGVDKSERGVFISLKGTDTWGEITQ